MLFWIKMIQSNQWEWGLESATHIFCEKSNQITGGKRSSSFRAAADRAKRNRLTNLSEGIKTEKEEAESRASNYQSGRWCHMGTRASVALDVKTSRPHGDLFIHRSGAWKFNLEVSCVFVGWQFNLEVSCIFVEKSWLMSA
jgi:23S rRNA A1618 N6-methylase RlmF